MAHRDRGQVNASIVQTMHTYPHILHGIGADVTGGLDEASG
jgi:hypothetical protein